MFQIILRFPIFRFLSIIGLLSLSQQASAQELLFSSLGNQVQLPSQECYKIMQDRDGYIWFSTDNGLCRYGNNQLQVFDKRNGLPEENVYVIHEDKTGKLWFATADNRILYYQNGELKEAPFNKAYQKFAKGLWAHPIPSFMDLNDSEHSIISNSYYVVEVNQKTNKVSLIPRTNKEITFLIEKRKGSPFIPSQQYFNPPTDNLNSILLRNGNKSKKIICPDLYKKFVHWNTPTALAGNTDFIGLQNKLFKVNADLSYTMLTLPDRILSLYVDKSNGLWVGVLNNGVYYYPDVNTMQLAHHSLPQYSVSGICEDHEQGIWCSTLEKGIFYSRNKNLLTYGATEGLDRTTTLLKYLDGRLYASSSGKELFVLKQDEKIWSKHLFPYDSDVFYSDILSYKNEWILSSKVIMLRADQNFNSVQKLRQPGDIVGAYALSKYGERLIGVMYHCLFEVSDHLMVLPVVCGLPFISKSILYNGKGTFLLGGNQGLFEYDINTGKYKQVKGIPENVRGLLQSRSGKIWVITKDDNIYWMDGTKVTAAGKQLNLKSGMLYDITEDRFGTVWGASNEGLYRFVKNGKKYTSSLYTTFNGLPSNEVYKVAADDKLIWFSTFEGLFSFPLNMDAKNTIGPAIHLQKLLVKNKESKVRQSITLPYDQNDFRFTFDILTFKNGSQNKLEYKLSNGKKTSLVKVNGNEILLADLPSGFYKLTVYGINNDGVKSSQPEIFKIMIKSPFWQTWWFILLVTFLVVFGVILLVRLIANNIRKGEEAKTLINKLMAEYQITALQAQMNPHFIFNAINTIQGYILEKNETEAYSYLAKFSKLIRMVLHNSQSNVLPLEKELEVLHLYIELEQLRFDNCFVYKLDIAKKMDITDFNVPGMLLQPYVENAIWHGIVNLRKSRRGKLNVSIKCEGELRLIEITDNGIGREKAHSMKGNTHHKSVGMQLTSERLEVMNQLHGDKAASVKVTDLFDETGIPSGTKVEISIPTNI